MYQVAPFRAGVYFYDTWQCVSVYEVNPFVDSAIATDTEYSVRRPPLTIRPVLKCFEISSYLVCRGADVIATFLFDQLENAFDFAFRDLGYQPSPKTDIDFVTDEDIDFVTHENENENENEADLLLPCSAQTCPTCAKPLLNLALSSGRKAVYCSNACKMQAYRQRSKRNDVIPLRNSDSPVSQYGYVQTSLLS